MENLLKRYIKILIEAPGVLMEKDSTKKVTSSPSAAIKKVSKVSFDNLNLWQDFPSKVPLVGRSGVGPGEDRLADIFGGEVQGQNVSFDLEFSSGPLAGVWEVKAPDAEGNIRPGTEGTSAVAPLMKILVTACDELYEFVNFPGVKEITKNSESKGLYDEIESFINFKKDEKGKTNYELIQSGEINSERFISAKKAVEAASKLIKKTQGNLLTIVVNKKKYQVTPTNMLKISKLLGMEQDESSSNLGDISAIAEALSVLNSPVFADPSLLDSKWNGISPDNVFDVTGVILVNEKGFMVLRYPYGDKIKISRISQGKPKFKVPLRGSKRI